MIQVSQSHCTHCTDIINRWISILPRVMCLFFACHWCHSIGKWHQWHGIFACHCTGGAWKSKSCVACAMSDMSFRTLKKNSPPQKINTRRRIFILRARIFILIHPLTLLQLFQILAEAFCLKTICWSFAKYMKGSVLIQDKQNFHPCVILRCVLIIAIEKIRNKKEGPLPSRVEYLQTLSSLKYRECFLKRKMILGWKKPALAGGLLHFFV